MKTTEELRKAHGTPREFAEAVWSAVGEISIDEARAAIAKYRREWDEAVDQELKRNAS